MSNIIEITDFFAPELDIYTRLNEVQLFHFHEPKKGLFIAESPKVIERALDAGYTPISFLLEKKHIEGEIAYRGDINGIKFMRKFYPYYISSVKNASKLRAKLVLLETKEEVYKVLDDALCIHASM